MRIYILTILSFILSYNIQAQYKSPLDIPLLLSGNFGELRNNHFHSGIDLKTQGVINKPVYSIEDGYVSRILKSPAGYGLALYITHPQTGQVSLYGHLNSFSRKIEVYIKEKQYEQESFRVDIRPEENLFPVKKGELIAYSGNSGSSGGPHVHFEIRDEQTEEILDPLPYFKIEINDLLPPDLRGIAIYPISSEGSVNESRNPLRQNITKTKKGEYTSLKTEINAWGKIGVAVKAYDRMTKTSNIYGVKTIKLYLDEEKIFESVINKFSFDQTRMLNTFIDFDDWRRNNSFFMKSFVEPGNRLPFYNSVNNGYIIIDEERPYLLRYELTDLYGNTSQYEFSITGQRQAILPHKSGDAYMLWDQDNRYSNSNFSLVIPKGNLYNNFVFTLKQNQTKEYLSQIYSVNDTYIPFHDRADIQIKIENDSLSNKKQYGIVSIKNNKPSWIGGTYTDGYIKTQIREIGQQFAISTDEQAPIITPIQKEKWEKSGFIKFKLTDNKSGISSFKGTIDGKFALFEHDTKSSVYTYKFDPARLNKEQTHKLIFTTSDACGNTTEFTDEFYY